MDIKEIKEIIKELHNICEDIDELHYLIICNKLFKLNSNIKPRINHDLYVNYNKEIENLFFESFINETTNHQLNIILNDIIYYISIIITMLNKIILNYP